MIAHTAPPVSAHALRERLSQLRREHGSVVPCLDDRSALADLPSDIAQALSPSLADRLARLRPWVGNERSSLVNPREVATFLGGELVDTGLARIEHLYPLPVRHGRAALNAGFHVPSAVFSKDRADPIAIEDAVFLDTETTGLSSGTGTVAFMIGSARFAERGLRVTQWMITSFAGERPMLCALSAMLANARLLVTYNGAAFDIPLLRTRFRMHGLADSTLSYAHADLLPWARRNRLKHWPDARLQTLEREGLGVLRVDDLPGAEVPKAWQQWLRAGDAGPLRRALEHNRLDLVTLVALLERAAMHPDSPARKCDPRQAWLFDRPTPWASAIPAPTLPFVRNPWGRTRPEAIQTVL